MTRRRAASSSAQRAVNPASVRRAVLACERRLTEAERTGDARELRALLAARFIGVDLHGRKVNRRAFIAGFLRPELKIETLRIDALTVRLLGDVAIVIGRSHFTGAFAGNPINGQGRFTDVWALRSGAWHLIASSVTRIVG